MEACPVSLASLQSQLKKEQAKFDIPKYRDRSEEIAANCAWLRREIRNEKLIRQKMKEMSAK